MKTFNEYQQQQQVNSESDEEEVVEDEVTFTDQQSVFTNNDPQNSTYVLPPSIDVQLKLRTMKLING